MTCLTNRVSPLAHVIETGNLEALLCLLDEGCDINAPMDRDGWPPICCAAACQNQEILAVLLKHGADPNRAVERGMAQGMVALAFCRDAPIAKMLLEAGARTDLVDRHGRTPLTWAIYMACKDVIDLLTE